MGQHEVHTVAVESVEQPRPRRARFDDDLQRTIRPEKLSELICIGVLDPSGSGYELTLLAHDTRDGIRCVSVDSCDSLIGYSVDDPLDDRIESLLIESVSAIDAKLGDEITGDLGRDLICIPRVFVVGT